MKNYIQEGDILALTAPSPGVVAGTPVKIGNMIVIPETTVATGGTFQGATEGVFSVPTDTGTVWAEGDTVYWDDTGKVFTKTSTSNTKCGFCASLGGKLSAATTAYVKLTGGNV